MIALTTHAKKRGWHRFKLKRKDLLRKSIRAWHDGEEIKKDEMFITYRTVRYKGLVYVFQMQREDDVLVTVYKYHGKKEKQ